MFRTPERYLTANTSYSGVVPMTVGYQGAIGFSQRGSTLIVVLFCLILIILAGTAAVMSSNTDLKLSTASQIDSLLFNSAEQPNSKIELETKSSKTDIFDATQGMLGYFMNDKLNAGNLNNKLVFCYRPKNPKLFELVKTATLTSTGGQIDKNANRPFCNVDNDKDYISDRNASMAQVWVTAASAASAASTSPILPVGADIGGSDTPKSYKIDINTVSSLPSYASVDDEDINACFTGVRRDGGVNTDRGNMEKTMTCLGDAGVPMRSVSQGYVAEYQDLIRSQP